MEKKVAAKAATRTTTKKVATVADELREVKQQIFVLNSQISKMNEEMHDSKYLYGKVKDYEIRNSFKGL